MEKAELTNEQRKEWQLLTKVLKALSYPPKSRFEYEVWKHYHFRFSPPMPPSPQDEPSLRYTEHGHLLIRILLHPDQSDAAIQSWIASLSLSHRGSCASHWLGEMLRIYKETGYEVFSGRTEWIMGLLLEGKAEKSEEWMTHFSGGRLMDDIVRWGTGGGIDKYLLVKSFLLQSSNMWRG